MNAYEIRIIRKAIDSTENCASSGISDYAAVRRAQNLAASNDALEVWRGATFVYSGVPNQLPVH